MASLHGSYFVGPADTIKAGQDLLRESRPWLVVSGTGGTVTIHLEGTGLEAAETALRLIDALHEIRREALARAARESLVA